MWLERKQIHKDHWYWYRRWRADGHVRSRYVGRSRASQATNLAVSESGQAREIAMADGQGPDLATDPGIAMAVNGHGQAMAIGQRPDLAADLGIAMAVNPVNDLAADLGIAMAVNPVDDLAADPMDDLAADPVIELNFPGDSSILIVNVAPGAAITTTQPATAKTTSITTNGVPAGNAASGRVDVSSKVTRDQPALKVKEDAS